MTRAQPKLSVRQTQFRKQYGPWAVVTGASDGIGRQMALRLAELGLNLVLVARRRDRLEEIASQMVAKSQIKAVVLAADLGTQKGIETVITATEELDVGLLVAAAGFGSAGPFINADPTAEYEMLDLNCRAVLALSLHFGKRLAKRGRGGIVLMASLLGFQGVPYAAHYAATKAYIQSFAEALHVELGSHGVDVVASAPGPVNSGFAQRAGMVMSIAMEPVAVVDETLSALGHKMTVTPGLLSKVLTYSLFVLPRAGRILIMMLIMRGMTKHLSYGQT